MAAPSKDALSELSHPANAPAIPHVADFDIDKTRVIVTRTGDEELAELNLRIRFLGHRQQLFFQLLTDAVPLRSEGAKKAASAKFYLFIPPSSLLSVRLADGQQYSTILRQETYQLHVSLKIPPDLVGPKLNPGYTAWRGKNPAAAKTIASLEALAGAQHFTITLPVSATARANFVGFCTATSPADALQPLPSAYNPANLYGGKGGHKYVPAGDGFHPESTPKSTDLPPYTQAGSHPPAYDGLATQGDAPRGEKRRRTSSSTSSDDGPPGPEKTRAGPPPAGGMPAFTLDMAWLKASVHEHLEDLKAQSMARMDARLDLLGAQVEARVAASLDALGAQVRARVDGELRALRADVDGHFDVHGCEMDAQLEDFHELLDGQQVELEDLGRDLDDVKTDLVPCLREDALDGLREELKEYLNEEALESLADLESFVHSCVEDQVPERVQSMADGVKADVERSVLRRMRLRKRRRRIWVRK